MKPNSTKNQQMINKQKMINSLNSDLKNELKHMNFYLYHASAVQGLHAEEYKEVFLKEAASEMGHVTAFSDVIWGLGGTPLFIANEFERFNDVKTILESALEMEEEVVENYVQRILDAEELGGVDGKWLEIFLEDQIDNSRSDIDRFRQLLSWDRFILPDKLRGK